MNRRHIHLPPLPEGDIYADTCPAIRVHTDQQLQDYAYSAIEPFQKRITELEAKLEAVGTGSSPIGRATFFIHLNQGIPMRITPEIIEPLIVAEMYDTAEHFYANPYIGLRYEGVGERFLNNALSKLTICVLVLKNGFTVVGTSAPISGANFDPKKGRTAARENAIKQLWPILGYAALEKIGETNV